MKSVVLSVRPKWIRRIASGEKTVEVRTSRPQQDCPFTCYIYCTARGKQKDAGKIVGEFTCTDIERMNQDYPMDTSTYHESRNGNPCLTLEELTRYGHGRILYGWKIENLQMYDEPMELADIGIDRAPQSWRYAEREETE